MLFSILIANYNNGVFFRNCYDSIISQIYKNWEVIIVDDCSTDNSVQEIKNIIGNDNRFKIYTNDKNYGAGYTKKKCIDLAKGDICGFLDPDDAIDSNAIDIMVKHHSESPEVGLCYSNMYICDENLTILHEKKTKQAVNKSPNFYNFHAVISHFATFKRKVYLETEGLMPNLKRAIDQDLYLKLYDKADVLHINIPLYLYRIHKGGISTFDNADNAYFWHWNVCIDTAKRRNVNIENLFYETFYRKEYANQYIKAITLLKKSRVIKILNCFGILKWIKKIQ